MNTVILNPDVQNFIRNFEGDTTRLAFSGSPFENVSVQELLEQITGYRTAKIKFPGWAPIEGIYYPPRVNMEQTSSEITAKYKANLVKGKSMADITAGFGVDSFYFSKSFDTVDHFEINEQLSLIAQNNFKALGCKNTKFYVEDGVQAMAGKKYNLIYVDPSRRDNDKRKVFLLEDCLPNIPEHLDDLLKSTDRILIKTSPMLDISIGIKALKIVSEIHVVAVENEVKELLWLLEPPGLPAPRILTINFVGEEAQLFEFEYGRSGKVEYGGVKNYLYEPNAAIMKSGGFSVISEDFGIEKLHKHTHLFSADELIEFPGRRFKVLEAVPYTKKGMRAGITFDKANVAARNFQESVSELKKRWKIRDGGNRFVFFTTVNNDKKMMLICEKVHL
ncbi:MAG: class I SAM-dependent methyltransferase [Flavobacterium sp.]|nr:MAG: class I SAM-dependent methyltransferase [Flavobacterium sp.]